MNWQSINIDYKFYRINDRGDYYVKNRRFYYINEQNIVY